MNYDEKKCTICATTGMVKEYKEHYVCYDCINLAKTIMKNDIKENEEGEEKRQTS